MLETLCNFKPILINVIFLESVPCFFNPRKTLLLNQARPL